MTYGIVASDLNGNISVSEEYKNYRVWASGYTPGNTFISFPASTMIPTPLIFVRPAAYGDTFTWFRAYDDSSDRGTSAGVFRYRLPKGNYVLATPLNGASSDTSGIRVWNSGGEVVFDSGNSYITIDNISLKTPNTIAQASTYSQTISLPQPLVGLRYFLLNPISFIEQRYSYSDDGCGGCGNPYTDYYWMVQLVGKMNSETSVTYNLKESVTTSIGTYMGPGMDSTTIPLVSAYINL